jgi:hypothetical protein
MATISTEHPDVIIANCITDCLIFARKEAEPLIERRRFYWRLLWDCNAQALSASRAFTHFPTDDPLESARVMSVGNRFDDVANRRFQGSPEQRTLFFKRLHQALSQHAYGLESECSHRADEPFQGDLF